MMTGSVAALGDFDTDGWLSLFEHPLVAVSCRHWFGMFCPREALACRMTLRMGTTLHSVSALTT